MNFKIIVIGDSGVGKSCLTQRACTNTYDTNCPPTVGADFRMYTTYVDGQQIKAQIWDTAGQELYADMCRAYYRGANGVIVCYDITNRASYQRVVNVWLQKMHDLCSQGIPSVLVGTKADLSAQRAVTEQEASVFAATNRMCGHMETSARTAYQVVECFDWIIREVLAQQKLILTEIERNKGSGSANAADSVRKPPKRGAAGEGARGGGSSSGYTAPPVNLNAPSGRGGSNASGTLRRALPSACCT